MVNSRPGLVTATPFCEGAPLLPKLRGQFAEFLNRGSLVHLRGDPRAYQCRCAVRVTLSPRLSSLRGFSRRPAHRGASAPSSGARRARWPSSGEPDLPGSRPLGARPALSVRPATARYRVPPSLVGVSAGLSTCCPSPTLATTSLGLGPD